jgi:hypothetical protein
VRKEERQSFVGWFVGAVRESGKDVIVLGLQLLHAVLLIFNYTQSHTFVQQDEESSNVTPCST